MKLLFFASKRNTECCVLAPHVESYSECVDVEQEIKKAAEYKVIRIPLLMLVDDDGKEIDRLQTTNHKVIEKWHKAHLASLEDTPQ